MLPQFSLVPFYFPTEIIIHRLTSPMPLNGIQRTSHEPHPVVLSWLNTYRHALENNTYPKSLIQSHTRIHSFTLGTGESLFHTTGLLDAITNAEREVIFVTCYWARSSTLSALGDSLRTLARRARERGQSVRVRICFSSLSWKQKLFQASSRGGKVWGEDTWESQLGLPHPHELRGLDIVVKSLFFLPLSVIHPKYVVLDRRKVLLLSCNVSWERWLEGGLVLSGKEVVDGFVRIWRDTWSIGEGLDAQDFAWGSETPDDADQDCTVHIINLSESPYNHAASSPPRSLSHYSFPTTTTHTTILLPHTHHRNPHFHPFPCQSPPKPPSTPLNTFLLHIIAIAKQHIYVQTPNLTSHPAISAIFDALQRGVDVTIVTSRKLMVLEQLVTAGTTTSWCITELMRKYEALTDCGGEWRRKSSLWKGGRRVGGRPRLATALSPPSNIRDSDSRTGPTNNPYNVDIESQQGGNIPSSSHSTTVLTLPQARYGKLSIYAYNPRPLQPVSSSTRSSNPNGHGHNLDSEPTHSHVKLTIVDSLMTVLGSGNMDRASWYTSQELGLAVMDGELAERMRAMVDGVNEGRIVPWVG